MGLEGLREILLTNSSGWVSWDSNGDGKKDTWFLDTNGDGKYDITQKDLNNDGFSDIQEIRRDDGAVIIENLPQPN